MKIIQGLTFHRDLGHPMSIRVISPRQGVDVGDYIFVRNQ